MKNLAKKFKFCLLCYLRGALRDQCAVAGDAPPTGWAKYPGPSEDRSQGLFVTPPSWTSLSLSLLTYLLSATLESLFTGTWFPISHQNLTSPLLQMNLESLFLSLKTKNILLNNAWMKKEIKREVSWYFMWIKTQCNRICQMHWGSSSGTFITLNVYKKRRKHASDPSVASVSTLRNEKRLEREFSG